MKVNIEGNVTDLRYWYIANPDDTTRSEIRLTSGINTLPKSYAKDDGQTYNIGFAYISGDSEITIEQIPSHAGALCLDGINDFGKVTGMPVYKDYTVVADYFRTKINISTDSNAPILSKAESTTNGAFMFNTISTVGEKVSYSFGTRNVILADDTERGIFYQSKYVNNGETIQSGGFIDNDKLWLGTYRDSDYRFIAAAIYSLMSFPYSMSEFLIERQLKKHKLGTLYPDMVEFRPVIKSNVNYQDIIFRNTSTGENLIVGQYYNLESISIYVKPLYYEEVSTIKVNNINAEFNSYDKNTGYYRFDCIVTKSPQKINLTIEQDENYVKFEPVIKSNASYDNIVFYYKNEKVENETYLTVGSSIGMHIRLSSNPVNEIKSITINGIPATFKYHDANNIYQYDFNLTSKSPQKINITIDEYIRYEDIVQPYPVLLRFNDENGNEVSWGGKVKLGSSITRIGSFNDCNLLKGIYTVSNAKLNGSPLPSTPHVVERQMVFTCTATYLLDNNEPKCILSPRLLRIPNSSYKILGHIPDISGHGNHGVIHNSAYAEGSGVNEDGSYQFDGVDDFVTIPTTVGGKQVLMKVNWNSLNYVLYDQRNNAEAPFCIVAASRTIAYNQRNVGGNTYIDGILNNHILVDDLQAITHNIVLNNDYNVANSNSFIGTNYTKNIYAKMSLYDFMLFDNISTDDKIKELNEYVGIEGNTE